MMRITHALAAVAAATIACGSLPSDARTFHQVEMTCPYDGTKFSFASQASGTSFGKALDLMETGPIDSPWPIAVCPTNGFVFFKGKFDDEELERLRPLVMSAEYQALKGETPYYRAAWLFERTGASHRKVSLTLLQATWEAKQDAERYERYATALAARLPIDIEASPDDKKMLQLVLGELLRRLGRFEEARQHFVRLAQELEPGSNEARVAAFQLRLIERNDREPNLISEALKP